MYVQYSSNGQNQKTSQPDPPFVFRYPDIVQIKKFNPRDLTSEEREKIIKAMFEHHHPVYKRLAEI